MSSAPGTAGPGGACRCRDDHLDIVAAAEQEGRDVGCVARRPSDVRRPDPGDDEHLHGGRRLRRRADGSRRSRTSSTAHVRPKAIVATSIAAAAPVAPQAAPNRSSSGSSTTISTPCATIRSAGRPIETGKRLRPAEHEPEARREEQDPGGVGCAVVLRQTAARSATASRSRRPGRGRGRRASRRRRTAAACRTSARRDRARSRASARSGGSAAPGPRAPRAR